MSESPNEREARLGRNEAPFGLQAGVPTDLAIEKASDA